MSFFEADVDRGDVDAGLLFDGWPLDSVLDAVFTLFVSDFTLTILIFTFSFVISTSKFDRDDDWLGLLNDSAGLSSKRRIKIISLLPHMKINSEYVPFPLVFVGCSDPSRGLLFWLGVAESLCTASLLGAAGRLVSVRSGVPSARASDDCVCETLLFVSLPLFVAVDVGVGVDVGVATAAVLDVIERGVETAATALGTVAVFVRLVVVEISVSRLFPELAFPFTALVVAPSTIADAGAATTADDDTPLSERISLSASDDCS